MGNCGVGTLGFWGWEIVRLGQWDTGRPGDKNLEHWEAGTLVGLEAEAWDIGTLGGWDAARLGG